MIKLNMIKYHTWKLSKVGSSMISTVALETLGTDSEKHKQRAQVSLKRNIS